MPTAQMPGRQAPRLDTYRIYPYMEDREEDAVTAWEAIAEEFSLFVLLVVLTTILVVASEAVFAAVVEICGGAS